MKKIILLILISIFLLNIGLVEAAFCCIDPETGQEKCFSEGQCCFDVWYPGCFWFDMWVEPSSTMFTVGKKTNVNLYIHDVCPYPDNYDLSYNIISPNPNLIKVDITGFEYIKDVNPNEIRVVYPGITILEASATGKILFNATSEGNSTIQNNATLTIYQSEFPMSLPEFEFSGIVLIVALTMVIFYLFKKFS